MCAINETGINGINSIKIVIWGERRKERNF